MENHGGQVGNIGSLKTGVRSDRPEMAIAALGKRFPRIARDVRQYARLTRAAVVDAYGRVSAEHEELINSAARFELAARIYQHLLDNGPKMSIAQTADLATKLIQATQYRRGAVARLDLNHGGSHNPWSEIDGQAAAAARKNPWSVLDAPPAQTPEGDAQAAQTGQDNPWAAVYGLQAVPGAQADPEAGPDAESSVGGVSGGEAGSEGAGAG